MKYEFKFEEKQFSLDEEKFIEIINDEEYPVENITLEKILELLNDREEVNFEKSYYAEPCESCDFGDGKDKFFPFLEYQFYINTKDGEYVTSNISKDSNGKSFNKLKRAGLVDSSYIVFIEVCENCGDFFISIEKVEE